MASTKALQLIYTVTGRTLAAPRKLSKNNYGLRALWEFAVINIEGSDRKLSPFDSCPTHTRTARTKGLCVQRMYKSRQPEIPGAQKTTNFSIAYHDGAAGGSRPRLTITHHIDTDTYDVALESLRQIPSHPHVRTQNITQEQTAWHILRFHQACEMV